MNVLSRTRLVCIALSALWISGCAKTPDKPDDLEHLEVIDNITGTADLIDEAEHPALLEQFDLETINNASFAVYLGGLKPKHKLATAVALSQDSNGLYALNCEGNAHLVLIIEVDGEYRNIATKDQLRDAYAPIDSPEEAVSFVHLEEGGFPTPTYAGTTLHEKVEEAVHVEQEGDTYKVTLVVSPACGHGEHYLNTYLVDHEGAVTRTSSQFIPHFENAQ